MYAVEKSEQEKKKKRNHGQKIRFQVVKKKKRKEVERTPECPKMQITHPIPME